MSKANTLHGELYLDEDGEAHFICHTPGDMSFQDARIALLKFIVVLKDQYNRQQECPHYEG